jgi:hypothetical protein
MKYMEHRPDCFSGYERRETIFTTLDELLATDTVVGRFAQAPDLVCLSLAERRSVLGIPCEYRLLMADMADKTHWVTGYLFGNDEELKTLGLPVWEECREKNSLSVKPTFTIS